ncbi:site-specific tyrosine recombinase/integron integrase [Candidatus Avelusimicrobium sp.]|uniref:site-specific tyrosine recombinase/integron integrase n=1 Tax=Candidatus Avelusimicrobium sp. TaxID=3048833 RepID=UPI003F7FD3C9
MTNQPLLEDFKNHLTFERQLSPNTTASYGSDTEHFLEYCIANEKDPLTIEPDFLDQYNYQLRVIEKLAATSIFRKMEAVKCFYKFLLIEEKIKDDPTRFLKSPKLAQKIPTQLTREEMDRLLSYPAEKFDEIRTVTIIELLYAAGLRVSELINLRLENVNLVEKWVLALGKGGKQRFVPIHDRAAERIKQYLSAREAHFAAKDVDSELFLNKNGKKISRVSVWKDLAALGRKANISQPLHPHLFRHTFASHLLQGGADLRSLQEMLGHANLTTTQIYTHLDVSDLKAKHKKFHPHG